MSFRENLKEAIKFKDIQYQELSDMTGINKRTLEDYTRENASLPSVTKAVEIASALGVSVEYLVKGNEDKNNNDTTILIKNKEISNILSKLDKNHLDAFTAMAKTLLQLQVKKK